MATFFNSPNMNLVLPVPTQAPGPDWAQEINASLTIIDAHDHSPGNGVLITPSGLNINSDISFNSNNATNLRTVRFLNNVASLPPALPDIGALYIVGANGDLYYNDTAGHAVPIIVNGILQGTPGNISGIVGSAAVTYVAVQKTYTFIDEVGAPANLDTASLVIRYPGSYPTPTGNFIILEAPTSLSSGYALVLPSLPAQTNVMTLSTSGTISSVTWDQVGQNMSSVGANAIANSRTRASAQTVGIGGVAQGPSSGNFTISNGSLGPPVDVPNLSVTLSTSGRPVFAGFFVNPLDGYLISNGNAAVYLLLLRNGITVSSWRLNFQIYPPGGYWTIEILPAGTFTYKAQLEVTIAGTGSTTVNNVGLVAYEL